jgi:hypothetical protein
VLAPSIAFCGNQLGATVGAHHITIPRTIKPSALPEVMGARLSDAHATLASFAASCSASIG